MDNPNPYEPTVEAVGCEPATGRFRWRVIPVTLVVLLTVLACMATVFDFSVLAYATFVGAPEGWQAEHASKYLRDGIVGLLQIPLLGLGGLFLWKANYTKAVLLLIPAFLLRSLVVWLFPL